jgi:hypothetical protein
MTPQYTLFGRTNLFAASSSFLHLLSAIFPNDAVCAKFTVFLRIAAGQAIFQTLVAVTILVLFAIKYTLSFWMIAAVTFIYHGGSSLLEKCISVKDRAHCVGRMEHRAWSIG